MGRTRRDLLSTVISLACTLSWPVWVMKANPLMPMMSPMSSSFPDRVVKGLIFFRTDFITLDEILDPAGRILQLAERSGAMIRWDIRRPAMHTSEQLPSSGSYSSAMPLADALTG